MARRRRLARRLREVRFSPDVTVTVALVLLVAAAVLFLLLLQRVIDRLRPRALYAAMAREGRERCGARTRRCSTGKTGATLRRARRPVRATAATGSARARPRPRRCRRRLGRPDPGRGPARRGPRPRRRDRPRPPAARGSRGRGDDRGRAGDRRAGRPVLWRPPTWEDLLALAFEEIRAYGADAPQIARRLRALLADLHRVAPPVRRPAIEVHQERLEAAVAFAFQPGAPGLAVGRGSDRIGIGLVTSG